MKPAKRHVVSSAASPAIGALVASIRRTAHTLTGLAMFPGVDEVALTVKVWGPSAEPRKRGTRTTAVNVPPGPTCASTVPSRPAMRTPAVVFGVNCAPRTRTSSPPR